MNLLPRLTLAILCLLIGLVAEPLPSHAENKVTPSQELYVGAFLAARKGEELTAAGDFKGALQAYKSAADALTQIKKQYPTWQKQLVDFRLGRVKEAIAKLEGGEPPKPTPAQPPEPDRLAPGKPAAAAIAPASEKKNAAPRALLIKASQLEAKADALSHGAGENDPLETYRAALRILSGITTDFPNWEPKLVDSRIQRIEESTARFHVF